MPSHASKSHAELISHCQPHNSSDLKEYEIESIIFGDLSTNASLIYARTVCNIPPPCSALDSNKKELPTAEQSNSVRPTLNLTPPGIRRVYQSGMASLHLGSD